VFSLEAAEPGEHGFHDIDDGVPKAFSLVGIRGKPLGSRNLDQQGRFLHAEEVALYHDNHDGGNSHSRLGSSGHE